MAAVNPDLAEERRKAGFEIEKLSEFFWHGNLQRRRQILKYVREQGSELEPRKPVPFMTRMEKLEDVARLSVQMLKHARRAIDVSRPEELFFFNSLICGHQGSPFHLHFIMAIPAMINNCDDDQAAEWIPPLLNGELIATYVQTEMGHGTNLRALETSATYDPAREQFVLNSPTITATKWWPGNLGKSANFAVVMAQLYTNGKCHGPHPFWVQLRDVDTHKSMPGVTIGDIGPKFGIDANDNGFLHFDNYMIPRRHMLMKHAKVLASGEYVPAIHAKVGYTSMMYVRSVMIYGHSIYLAQAVTIAIRYSCVRRQGHIGRTGEGEVKVLDYRTQQYRLFPQLARVFAIASSGLYIRQMYHTVIGNINAGDATLLADLHSLSSGLKALTSWQITQGVEQCRLACGGHGYSEASGLPSLYTTIAGSLTYEGENIVMLLQTARSLMKLAGQIRSGGAGEGSASRSPVTAYLRVPAANANKRSKITQESGPEAYLETFEELARKLVFEAFDELRQQRQRGLSAEEAWNESGVLLTKASRAHATTFIARTFSESVPKIADPGVKSVVQGLLWLHLSYELLHCAASLLEVHFLSGQQMQLVRHKMNESLARIRPNAVAIVDSFDFTDRELNSVLGRYDGMVYENLLEWAKQAPTNAEDVLPFHAKYLGKAMKEARDRRVEEMSKI